MVDLTEQGLHLCSVDNKPLHIHHALQVLLTSSCRTCLFRVRGINQARPEFLSPYDSLFKCLDLSSAYSLDIEPASGLAGHLDLVCLICSVLISWNYVLEF